MSSNATYRRVFHSHFSVTARAVRCFKRYVTPQALRPDATKIAMLCFTVLTLFATAPTLAEQLSDEQAIEAGREALEGEQRFPWYDSESDGLQRLDVKPPAEVSNRDSKWERIQRTKKKKSNWSMPAWLWTMLEVAGWTLLIMALTAVGYLLVRAFLMAETGSASGQAHTEGVLGPGDVDRVESLPFQLKAPKTDLLSEARRHYESGNYKDAIIYFYSYQLVELDKHQLIRLTKGKTNRQYLRELRRRNDLMNLLRVTMVTFEDVFFGNHTIDRQQFESCWNGLDAFRQNLEATA